MTSCLRATESYRQRSGKLVNLKMHLSNRNQIMETETNKPVLKRAKLNCLNKHIQICLKMILLVTIISIVNIGCECNKVECSNIDKSYVELNFISEGEDIIFGASPLIQIEELEISSETQTNILYSTFEDQIGLWLENDLTYTITVGELDTISIIGMLVLIETGDCCDAFGFETFSVNGIEICNTNCSELNISIE